MATQLVVHYGEIGTKGNNRVVFERSLERNLESALRGLAVSKIEKVDQRLLLEVAESTLDEALGRLRRIFGVAWFASVKEAELSYESIRDAAAALLKEQRVEKDATFRIVSRRSNKMFEIASRELAVRLGEEIRSTFGIRVSLTEPDVSLYVDVLSDRALVFSGKRRGPGGLPVGVSGRVMHLLSGGIDSAVAAWLMMKRGCLPIYLHFYVARDASEVLESKVARLIKTLSVYSGKTLLLVLPFSAYQLASAEVPPHLEPTLFRHFARVVAEKLAADFKALAVSTGDNLGQVASQTLHNLRSIDSGSKLPVLRPLLGYDKTEIIELAKSIGTYEISIEPYKDCCSIISRHPKTRLKPSYMDLYSRKIGFEALAERTIALGSLASFDEEGEPIGLKPLTSERRG